MLDSATNTLDLTTQSPAVDTTHTTKIAGPVQTQKQPAGGFEVCGDGVCGNGGTCHRLPGEPLPSCHCPLHFTGAFCEKGEAWTFELSDYSSSQVWFWFTESARAAGSFKERLTSAVLSSRTFQQILLVNICRASFANTFHNKRERDSTALRTLSRMNYSE